MTKIKNLYNKVNNWLDSTDKHDLQVKRFLFVCCVMVFVVVILVQYVKLNGMY